MHRRRKIWRARWVEPSLSALRRWALVAGVRKGSFTS